jgi:hypothetical protein
MKQKLTARDIQSYIKLIVWVFVIGYLCFSSGGKFDNLNIDTIIPAWLLPHMDKMVHFTMFFCLAFLIRSLRWQDTIDNKLYIIYLTMGVAYAATTEVVQYFFIAQRSGDILDFGCDVVGMALSLLIFPYWPKIVRTVLG